MFPVLFTVPIINFTIHTFGVMVLLGALAALQWVKYDSKRRGLDPEEISSIAVEVFLAGLLGTRVFFVLLNWSEHYAPVETWGELFFKMINIREGGLVWYGGPLAALPVIWLRLRHYAVNPLVICDVWAPGLAIGHAIGRIGCLMAGDDYGKRWSDATWWPQWATVTFDHPQALLPDEFKHQPLLPSQPLMFLGVFTLFLILVKVRKKIANRPGTLPALYFTLYPIHRFLVEYTRGDEGRGFAARGTFLGDLSTSQAVSLLMFPFALIALYYFFRVRPVYEGPHRGDPWPDPSPPAPAEAAPAASPAEGAGPA